MQGCLARVALERVGQDLASSREVGPAFGEKAREVSGDADRVLDGDLNGFIRSALTLDRGETESDGTNPGAT